MFEEPYEKILMIDLRARVPGTGSIKWNLKHVDVLKLAILCLGIDLSFSDKIEVVSHDWDRLQLTMKHKVQRYNPKTMPETTNVPQSVRSSRAPRCSAGIIMNTSQRARNSTQWTGDGPCAVQKKAHGKQV